MHEPQGHTDMYGALVTEPVTVGADFGVLFLHNGCYSSMCGDGILALVKVMCETDSIVFNNLPRIINIDAPAGLITAKVYRDLVGKVQASFKNVDSWAEAIGCEVMVNGFR